MTGVRTLQLHWLRFICRLAAAAFAGAVIFTSVAWPDNPLIPINFGSPNPSPIVENGVVYMYTTEDPVGAGSISNINHHVWTSRDLYHWEDSGVVLTEADVAWVDPDRDHMWAPTVHKLGDRRYHLYWPGATRDGLAHIGHAVADRPTGPFIPDDDWMQGCGDEALDPFVVDSGNGVYYIVWDIVNITPNHVYIRKLNESFDDAIGTRYEITEGLGTPTDYKEGMWYIKQNGIWYHFYAHWPTNAERIAYSTATNLLGPYTFGADLMNENTNSPTIHPGIISFNDRWIMFWHCGGDELGGSITDNEKRVAAAEYFSFDTTTNPWSIAPIPKTLRGVGIPNAYHDTIQIDRCSAIDNAEIRIVGGGEPPGWMVSRIENNAWVRYDDLDFTPDPGYTGPVTISARVASTEATDSIEVRLNSETGTLLGKFGVPNTGGLTDWETITDTIITRTTGVQNLVLVFDLQSGSNNVNVNWVTFGQEQSTVNIALKNASGRSSGYSYQRADKHTLIIFSDKAMSPEIKLYNLKGMELKHAVKTRRISPTRVRVSLLARHLSSGAYFLSLKSRGEVFRIPFRY